MCFSRVKLPTVHEGKLSLRAADVVERTLPRGELCSLSALVAQLVLRYTERFRRTSTSLSTAASHSLMMTAGGTQEPTNKFMFNFKFTQARTQKLGRPLREKSFAERCRD
jgi:hypothetical protein